MLAQASFLKGGDQTYGTRIRTTLEDRQMVCASDEHRLRSIDIVCLGSLAIVFYCHNPNISPAAAIGCKAVTRRADTEGPRLNVCLRPKRSFANTIFLE